MATDPKFTQYRAMLSDLAAQGLAWPMDGAAPDSLALVQPAARLLLRDDRANHAGLVRAMQALADVGRPWLRVGVNVGTLASLQQAASASLTGEPADRMLRRYALDFDQPHAPVSRAFPIPMRDAAGHTRDIYHPLAVHLCLAAFHRCYETLPQSMWGACEQSLLEMVAPLRFIECFADSPPPPKLVPLVLWQALAIAEQSKLLSRDIDLELVDVVVQSTLSASPGDAPGTSDPVSIRGALHRTHQDDSIDTWTYRELVALHALANLALRRRNANWAKRVEQVALYHVEHTQPDNATNQPWALFAFLWSSNPAATAFADQQLHDLTAHAGGRPAPGSLAALLLADAADCLAEFG